AMDSSGSDAAAAARALQALKPQAVVMVAAGPSVVAYVRAHRAQQPGVPVYTLSLGAGEQVLTALGDGARGWGGARGRPPPPRPRLGITREFRAAVERRGLEPSYARYHGYLAARVLCAGLRAAGPGVTGPSLVQAMEGLGRLDLGGHTYQ